MSEFKHLMCDPFNPKVIEKGSIDKHEIISTFSSFPWSQYLERMLKAKESEIHYSPSLEFENKQNKNGIEISAVGLPKDYEFYVFFKRPKLRKRFFGLYKKIDNKYLSDLTGQREKDVLDCLQALIDNDLQYLERKFE